MISDGGGAGGDHLDGQSRVAGVGGVKLRRGARSRERKRTMEVGAGVSVTVSGAARRSKIWATW